MAEASQPFVLTVRGTLCGDNADELRDTARRALREGWDVIVDLAEVSFADSAGLSALVAAYKSAIKEQHGFALRAVPPNLVSLLELTRLHRVFTILPAEEPAGERSAK